MPKITTTLENWEAIHYNTDSESCLRTELENQGIPGENAPNWQELRTATLSDSAYEEFKSGVVCDNCDWFLWKGEEV